MMQREVSILVSHVETLTGFDWSSPRLVGGGDHHCLPWLKRLHEECPSLGYDTMKILIELVR